MQFIHLQIQVHEFLKQQNEVQIQKYQQQDDDEVDDFQLDDDDEVDEQFIIQHFQLELKNIQLLYELDEFKVIIILHVVENQDEIQNFEHQQHFDDDDDDMIQLVKMGDLDDDEL